VCVVSVDGRLDVNVALNRRSWLSSTYGNEYRTHWPRYANDGNNDSNHVTGPCAMTLQQPNPWFAVDLGAALHVAGVKFTNTDEWGKFSAAAVDIALL